MISEDTSRMTTGPELAERPPSGRVEQPAIVRGWTRRWRMPTTDRRPGDPLLRSILVERGRDLDQIFLEPSLLNLHDPSLMPGLDAAAEIVLGAVRAGKKIAVFGDYDVDGVTATTILTRTLRELAPEWATDCLTTYIPHRVQEGYGLNVDALTGFAEQGIEVVVTVDCGITAIEPAERARQLGIELVITDHHNADERLPDAAALVHPGLPGSRYPFEGLCGAGVVYKLAWRLCTKHVGDDKLPAHLKSLLVNLLAFASLGTIADVVPLIDENRAIARFGLSRVRGAPFVGLRALVAASGLDSAKIGEEDVGFKLAPRLNAVGRLGHARDALELFLTEDTRRAAELAGLLSGVNEQRRATERKIFEQAVRMVEEAGMDTPERRAIVLAHEDWHPGVVGIVASRLVERFGRPTLLMTRDHGVCKGSGRSLDGFNLHAALSDCSDMLTRFGGHNAAAGLALQENDLDAFTESFVERVNTELAPNDLAQTLTVDAVVGLDELTVDAVRHLDALRPFGTSNPAVRLMLSGVSLAGPPETFGRDGSHLALRLTEEHARGSVRAIAWRWGDKRSDLRAGQRIDAVVRPDVSDFSGRVEPVIEDLRVREA